MVVTPVMLAPQIPSIGGFSTTQWQRFGEIYGRVYKEMLGEARGLGLSVGMSDYMARQEAIRQAESESGMRHASADTRELE